MVQEMGLAVVGSSLSYSINGIGFFAWKTMWDIDEQAFRQPTVARGNYLHPENIKGHIYYLTAEQDHDLKLASYAFDGVWLVLFGSGITLNVLRKRNRRSKQNDE